MSEGFFSPNYKKNVGGEVFSMVLPPPNITGTLHLGHALTNSVQDALVRWNRMRGKQVVWVPGCDHAGIATQVVVEKKLWRERKLSKQDIGRDRFIAEVWKWKDSKGGIIMDQMKRLGSSLDWSKECFTMDKNLTKAVVEAFVQLHDKGLIYRSNRLVNWSCSLQSAISDIEVDNINIDGKTKLNVPGYEKLVTFGTLTSFSYPVENSDEKLTIATTRPETMLGDVAVAIHPDDIRYKHLHGNHVIHPVDSRRLPIIVDDFVDKSFGTGAVKITPAHDYTDYDVSKKHHLPLLTVIDTDGRMINTTPEFNGQKRFDVRWMIVKYLKEKNLFVDEVSHNMTIPLCSRSGDVVEPLIKDQWFLDCKQMANRAVQAVEKGDLNILARSYEKVWFDWLNNIREWCISRQLWWGHRIPAYRVTSPSMSKEVWVSARSAEEAREKAACETGLHPDQLVLNQDEDVLDTWFSSALFPFAVHGWPQETEELSRFYPTNLLETGSDILFFWVARMVMLGQELTGKLPFNQVLLHGLLKDSAGRKMSKSLGNVINPVDVMNGLPLQELQKQVLESNLDEKEIQKALQSQRKEFPQGLPECGADALRFSLCSYDFKGGEINLDVNHGKSFRHFCNKIWQGFRFVFDKFDEDFTPVNLKEMDNSRFSAIDQWILSRLGHMVMSCDDHFRSYDLHNATRALHYFWQSEFCDVYLECVKSTFTEGNTEDKSIKQQIFFTCTDTFLRAISPFMPFLSEELYQRLPHKGDNPVSICVASYPQPEEYVWKNEKIEEEVKVIQIITNKVLSIRKDFNLTRAKADTYLKVEEEHRDDWKKYLSELKSLTRASSLTIITDTRDLPDGCVLGNINDELNVYLNLQNMIDKKSTIERLKSQIEKLEEQIVTIDKKIQNLKDSDAKLISERNGLKTELEKLQGYSEIVQDLKG